MSQPGRWAVSPDGVRRLFNPTYESLVASEQIVDIVDGSVPAEQIEELVEAIRRSPFHPGILFRDILLGDSVTPEESAELLDITLEQWTEGLQGRAPVARDLALKMEAIGWARSEFWLRLQRSYGRAQIGRP